MKTFKGAFLICMIFNFSCAQEKPTYLDINQISIHEIDYKTTVDEAIWILGKPMQHNSIDDQEAEYGDTPATYDYLIYNDLELNFIKYEYMKEKQLSSINIKSSKIDFNVNDESFKVGDKIERIKSILSYEYHKFLEMQEEIEPDKKYQIIGGNLTRGKLEPSNIVFDFENGKITQISIGFPR